MLIVKVFQDLTGDMPSDKKNNQYLLKYLFVVKCETFLFSSSQNLFSKEKNVNLSE